VSETAAVGKHIARSEVIEYNGRRRQIFMILLSTGLASASSLLPVGWC
jgi:hypothetical protein